MKAATIARYGSPGVIEVRDVPAPVPGPDEVLVRVHAATVNRTDCGELLHPTVMRLLTGAGTPREFQARASVCLFAAISPAGGLLALLIVVAGDQTAALALSIDADHPA